MSAAGLAVCCFAILWGRAVTMQYAVLQPLPMDDEDPKSRVRLPGDATRSEWHDENVHGRRQQVVPWTNPSAVRPASREHVPLVGTSPSLPHDLSPESGMEDPTHKDVGRVGAGFGAACGHRHGCISSLGLACLKTERQDYRCGCAKETPVFINEGGVKKCVRAKSMYESCVSHLECSYKNPNLQCVDFLCYCPLPYVLTEAHRCLAPSGMHNSMVFAIAPTMVLLAVLFVIGGAYTYKKVAGGGDVWPSASSLFTIQSATEQPSESTRHVSSAIRLGRKAGSGRKPRLSLYEHRAALRDSRAPPLHPPRYIRPREQSAQKSLQDVRVKAIKEGSPLPSESSGLATDLSPPRSACAAASKAANGQLILPVREGASVYIIHKSPASCRASQEPSNEVSLLRKSRREVDRPMSPTLLLRRMLDESEVKVNVLRSASSSDNQCTQRSPLPKLLRDQSSSQPSELPACKFLGYAKGESTTEDSFMREIRYHVETCSPRPSVNDRVISSDAAFTADSAVQLDKSFPDKLDKSQQMSDVPNMGIEYTAVVSVEKLVQEMEHKTTVPVQMLVQEIEQKEFAANETVPTAKQIEERTVKCEFFPLKDSMKKKPENIETYSSGEKQQRSGISSGERLTLSGRMRSDSLRSTTGQTAEESALSPLPVSVESEPQRPVRSDFIHATTDNVEDKEKIKMDGGSVNKMPTSPKFCPKVMSDVSTTRSPAFRAVLEELIHQHTQRKAPAPSREGEPRNTIPGNAAQQPSGPTSTAAESAICSSLARTTVSPKGSARESASLLMPLEATRNFSPPMPPRFHTTTAQESVTLWAPVQGSEKAAVKGKSSNETRSDGGKLRHEIKDSASPCSLNSPTTAVDESRPRHVRSLPYPHRPSDGGKRDETRAAPMQQVRLGRSSDNLIANGDKQPPKLCAWGDSFSETPSDESILRGCVPPNSPRNSGIAEIISLSQGLETAQTAADARLEQTSLCPRIENDWNLTSPEVVLGSVDMESSETSLGGLRATLKKSVDVTCPMLLSRNETALVVPALKDKKTKRSERQKRVTFQERPFAEVLAEIEDDYMDPEKAESVQGDKEEPASSDIAADESTESSKSEYQESSDDAFSDSCIGAGGRNGIREVDEKNENKGQPLVAFAQNVGGRQVDRQIVAQVSAQFLRLGADRSFVEWRGHKGLAVHSTDLSLQSSREAVLKEALVSNPFCPSDEGPLPFSASTTLSFLSSESSVSVAHRVTDLASLHTLADLVAPFQETGDGKSRTAAANLPDTPKPDSCVVQGLHHSQREPLPQHQEGEQQWSGHPKLSSPGATPAEDKSACSSLRLRTLKQAKLQDSSEDRNSSRPPNRPNTSERQRVGRFAAKERRWDDDIIQVIMMGNKHYLHERSITSPRPLSASVAVVPPLDETQYIAQQIELTHATNKDANHACPSPELRLAAGVTRTVTVPVETVITTAHSRDLSACDDMQALARPRDAGLDQQVPLSPSGRASQQSSPGACSGPQSAVTSPDPLAATHRGTWGPSGEQPVETIAEAVCEIELQYPQAVSEAVGPKGLELVTGDVFSGDTIELVKSPVQIGVFEDSMDHLVPSLTSVLGGESLLTLTWPQWDAPERDLPAFVKLHSAAVGTPESFSKTIGLPSAEGLLMSDTSTLASRVDAAATSSIGCSVVLEPSASLMSHARSGSSKSVRSRRHSAKVPEGPCFESIYNSILQPRSSPGLPLGNPRLGSRDFSVLLGTRESLSGSDSECSAVPSLAGDLRDGGAVAIAATTSSSVSLAPGFSAPQLSEGGSYQAPVPHIADAAAVFGEDATEDDNELKKHTPPPNGEAPPNYYNGCGVSHPRNSGVLPQGDVVVSDIQDDPGCEEDGRSSFFSFEQSASETSLLPDAVNLDWSTSSAASWSREDRG